MIGPPCSGKTTYSKKLEDEGYVRVSQDDQGYDHKRVFRNSIFYKKNLVIDRMNFNEKQRRKYTKLAKEAGYIITFIEFKIQYSILKERFLERKDHPTLNLLDTFIRVYNFYLDNYESPKYNEYDELKIVEE